MLSRVIVIDNYTSFAPAQLKLSVLFEKDYFQGWSVA